MPKTLAQIQKQIARLEEQARAIKEREVSDVVGRIKEAIEFYGLTPADLGFGPGGAKRGPRKARGKKAPAGKRAARKAVAAKYKDDQGHSWSGRGRRPKWFVDAIAAGKTPEQLAA